MTLIELIWTITPALILIAIAFPSFRLLYLLDEVTSPTITIKVTGQDGLTNLYNNLNSHIIKFTSIYLTSINDLTLSLTKEITSLNKSLSLKLYSLNPLAMTRCIDGSSFLLSQPQISRYDNTLNIRTVLLLSPMNDLLRRTDLKSSNCRTKPSLLNINSKLSLMNLTNLRLRTNLLSKTHFHTRCRAINRVGPHNLDVISLIFGLVLGDGYMNSKTGEGVRIAVKQSIIHKEYLFSLYEFFNNRGYCTSNEPRLYTRQIKGNDKIYKGYEFNTFTFRSLVWVHKLFYKHGQKIIPINISDYFTNLSLAIWISDDGGWTGSGVRIACNSFSLKEVVLLSEMLRLKFELDCTIQKIFITDKYSIYIKSNSIDKLRILILPYLHSTMHYKLGL